MTELLVIGASGLAREVLSCVRETGQFDVVGVLDDDDAKVGSALDGAPILGPVSYALRYPAARVVVCIGAGRARERVVARLAGLGVPAYRFATVVDPSVRVPSCCEVGPGSILLGNVTLTAAILVGSHVVLMPGVTLTHDDVVEDFATLAAGVCLGGGVRIGRAAYLGMNSSVREGTTVGSGSVIGMGAAVLADVPPDETWAGVPARVLKPADAEAGARG
ncbi:NeuD/PglB/VioB family sugar acetyltransferase [Arthrobacter sp. H16F315]|uniref:NeuD/PglB/VioB family sugar acetyltransferase n=1 Tax=Arthrobacter sp. H16F315 TaxID=2955314 RepID=UPI0020970404|nr:NeuD/PglB/VioB family sugar acetyltransferase [Arthrobacter sp. H16F315]MDD1476221.1 NeuD/PglB/VioB family sugar acetyltransferase [Arthrobacter sp. H16F315]